VLMFRQPTLSLLFALSAVIKRDFAVPAAMRL
jgi:hypothetical protein